MTKLPFGVLLGLALAVSTSLASGQAADTNPAFVLRIVGAAPSPEPSGGALVREIDDPFTGERWVMSRDDIHPGGPGRWMRVSARVAMRAAPRGYGSEELRTPARVLVIHSGDQLILEEHTAVADARLAAVALGSAASGAEFRVRLQIGGTVVDAVALGPGRAVFAEEKGTWQ